MSESASVSPLQKLLSGMPAPNPPQFNPSWTLERYQQEMVIFHQKLLEYIARLMQQLTARNLVMEIITILGTPVVAVQYNITNHQLQIKTIEADGTVSDWTMISGGQAVPHS